MNYPDFIAGIWPAGFALSAAAAVLMGIGFGRSLPKGRGFAATGMILSVVGTVLVASLVVIIAVPIQMGFGRLTSLVTVPLDALTFALESGIRVSALALPLGPAAVAIARARSRRGRTSPTTATGRG